jgi:hypothetical protein
MVVGQISNDEAKIDHSGGRSSCLGHGPHVAPPRSRVGVPRAESELAAWAGRLVGVSEVGARERGGQPEHRQDDQSEQAGDRGRRHRENDTWDPPKYCVEYQVYLARLLELISI